MSPARDVVVSRIAAPGKSYGIHRIPYWAAKGRVNAVTAGLAIEPTADDIGVNAVATVGTNAPPRKVARNYTSLSAREEARYQTIVN